MTVRILAALVVTTACASADVGPVEKSADRLWIQATGLSLAPGDKLQLGVTAADSAVTTYHQFPDYSGDPWPSDLRVRWWTADTTRAVIDAGGVLSARAAGATSVWVAAGATTDSGTLMVETTAEESGFASLLIAGGLSHTCAVDDAGRAYCWGSDFDGALGRGRLRQFNAATAPSAVAGGRAFVDLSVGADYACGLTATGVAYCWGGNQWGQLGDGTDGTAFSEIGGFGRATPSAVLGGHAFVTVRAGGFHVCALDAGGQAFCWGLHGHGQLGIGPYEGAGGHRSEPTAVAGSLRVRALGIGAFHSCAIGADGLTYCWGLNNRAQLGIDSTLSPERCAGGWRCSTMPIALDTAFRFVALAAGLHHSCGLAGDGTVYCWGNGSPLPLSMGTGFVQIAAGALHTCALKADGAAYCWGENDYGQLGDGTLFEERLTPVPVATTIRFATLGAGSRHTCGAADDRRTYCWGWNGHGQIGNGKIQQFGPGELALVPAPERVRARLP